jgi:phenylacetate-CoA ligase
MTEKRVINSVRDAYRNVPFYRQKYDAAGINIDSIRRLEDMKLLPILTKEEIRSNFPGSMVRQGTDIDKCFHSNTSGSSGQPLSFIISPSGYAYYLAESARIYSMIGYRPWHRSCYLRSKSMSLPKASASRQTFISSGLPVTEQIEQLKRHKPHLIDAHPSTLLDIARYIKKEDLKYIKPRFITVNSEMSTLEERNYIAGVFGCPVYDEYGSYEVWSIATQCRKHNYHISSDSVWLEFLDDQGNDVSPGEVGNIVITSTRSKSMPFIRYSIGDTGEPAAGTCSCGYKTPMMQSLTGRVNDWLVLPSGKLMNPTRVLRYCGQADSKTPFLFDRYKLVQEKCDRLVFYYVKGRDFDAAILNELLEKIRGAFDEPVEVLLEEGLPQSGEKRQVLQSLVEHRNLI